MSVRDDNVQAIVSYFESGIKDPAEPGRLGVEIEHFVTDKHSGPVMYSDEYGVRWILEQLAGNLPNKMFGSDGSLIGVQCGNISITLEPAAQFEISSGPYEHVGELMIDYEEFQRAMRQVLDPHGHRLVATGYHPTAQVDQMELIPKQRYRFMDEHFQKIGPFGRCMMRGSAATQISIDYYSVDDCLRKLRLSSALAPLFSLLCDNSPVFEGAPRTHQLVRTKIWKECDPARCGTVPGVLEDGFTFEDYADYILRTPAILYVDDKGKSHATGKTFGELYANAPMDKNTVEHALSMFFNDVRLKTYIEIRPADSMPIPFVAAYAALLKGLFYYPDSLDKLDELVGGVTENDVVCAKEDLMERGYDAVVYGKNAGEMIDELFDTARAALPRSEAVCLNPLAQIAGRRKTLATMGEKR